MISISENFLVESVFFFTKQDMSLPKTRYVYLPWPFYFMKDSVEGSEIKDFNAITGGDGP